MKIKHTESSSSQDEYQYYRKKSSKQRKNKQKYYDYEYYDDEDYCDGPRVKQNKRKNITMKKKMMITIQIKRTQKKEIPRRRV